jgi:uncharacterized protein YceK
MKSMCVMVSITLVFLAACSGCASIAGKTTDKVNISSTPSGATIQITNKAGTFAKDEQTPAVVVLKKGAGWFKAQNYTVEFKKPGYETVKAEIEQGLSGWYIIGNFFIGGPIGWLVVDPITGAMWTLDDLHVTLKPVPGAFLPTNGEVRTVSLDQVPVELRPRMVRIR